MIKKQRLIINDEDIMEVSSISLFEDQFVRCINDTNGNQGLIIDINQIIHKLGINISVEKSVYWINDTDVSS